MNRIMDDFYFTKYLNIMKKGKTYEYILCNKDRRTRLCCEGRPEGQEIKDKVFLKQETTKEEMIIYMEDKLLYDRNVDEGTKVIIDEDGRLQKA